MDPFLGQIKLFSFNFPPRGWALCAGQLLPIAQNQALFALLGTTYGGNGTTTFALPDLRGRVAVSEGGIPLGAQFGAQAVTLLTSQIPQHTHNVSTGIQATDDDAAGNYPAITGGHLSYGQPQGDGAALDELAIWSAGSSQPHINVMPYLGMNYCIALQGIFPSRN